MRTLLWIGALLFAAALWVALGFLATAPLGWAFGWTGHPSIPAAPTWVYVVTYLVVLPAVCLGASFALTSRLIRRRRG